MSGFSGHVDETVLPCEDFDVEVVSDFDDDDFDVDVELAGPNDIELLAGTTTGTDKIAASEATEENDSEEEDFDVEVEHGLEEDEEFDVEVESVFEEETA